MSSAVVLVFQEPPVTPEDITAIADAVWQKALNDPVPVGSYGDRIKTRIDATISSRATPADVSGSAPPPSGHVDIR